MSHRLRGGLGGRRLSTVLFVSLVAALGMPLLASPAWAPPVTGAISTTDNPGWLDTYDSYANQACLNGNGVNCNIYLDKRDVWFSGLPTQAALGAGTYFFAVLSPGGQPNPNDCAPLKANGNDANLSDTSPCITSNTGAGDTWTNRTFSVDGSGTITYPASGYPGGHDFDSTNNRIQVFPYDDTPNPGGVYILAICAIPASPIQPPNGPGVDPSICKYDAFKVQTSPVAPGAIPPVITKDAAGSYDDTYTWTITKNVDKTVVKQIGGNATFNYTVTVSHGDSAVSNVKVTGQIQVFNFNLDGDGNVVPVDITGASDKLSDGTVCTVTNGGAQTLTLDETDFTYTCDLGNALPSGTLTNTAKVSWPDQDLSNGTHLTGPDSASFTFPQSGGIGFTANEIDECVTVVDDNFTPGVTADDTTLGTVCVGDAGDPTFTFTHSRTVPVPAHDCLSYTNTATFTTNDTGTTGSASKTVQVCGPGKTGALTIGFWKTTNGQNLIKYYCQNPALANYLKGLGSGSGPFSDAPTTSCTALAGYVLNILKGASATNMNKMLKAQMMGTALDVWFSGPGWTSTKVSGIKPPSAFLSNNHLGTFNMDTTAVCPMVDNLSTGTATCTGGNPSTNAVTAGAVPTSPMSMQSILDFAATTPSPFNGVTGTGSVWYGGDRTKEEILKNIFDQFNNGDAFGSF